MKTIFTLLILCSACIAFAQTQEFQLQGKIVNQDDLPIGDVYIVNPRTHEKDISHGDGVFTVNVLPGDSLILSHISFKRTVFRVLDLLADPIIVLKTENQNIKEVVVRPDKMTDLERAQKNLQFLKNPNFPTYTIIKTEADPLSIVLTEHNRLMRVEAASISLGRFSPSAQVSKLLNKLKKKDRSNDYYSTRRKKPKEK